MSPDEESVERMVGTDRDEDAVPRAFRKLRGREEKEGSGEGRKVSRGEGGLEVERHEAVSFHSHQNGI